MTTPITLTDAAVNHIQTMIQKDGKAQAFRLSVKKTGCSGNAYLPEIVATGLTTDLYFKTQQGLTVYIDSKCVELINGLIVDYAAEEGNILKQKHLIFINPNEKNRCGCGESFIT